MDISTGEITKNFLGDEIMDVMQDPFSFFSACDRWLVVRLLINDDTFDDAFHVFDGEHGWAQQISPGQNPSRYKRDWYWEILSNRAAESTRIVCVAGDVAENVGTGSSSIAVYHLNHSDGTIKEQNSFPIQGSPRHHLTGLQGPIAFVWRDQDHVCQGFNVETGEMERSLLFPDNPGRFSSKILYEAPCIAVSKEKGELCHTLGHGADDNAIVAAYLWKVETGHHRVA